MFILGISAYYHDSAAALIGDGEILAAAQEERFTRKKHDARFPANAITYCLAEAGISLRNVEHVVFYDKPFIKFERLLETYIAYAPKGFQSFVAAMPVWMREKLFLKQTIRRELAKIAGMAEGALPQLMFAEHHQSHAASAYFPSPFDEAAVLCLDGVGEWATTTAWHGVGNELTPLWEINFPHSLGLLYSAFTYYSGFKVNSGEYKLMGLAPYGEPKYVDLIRQHLIDIKDDGTYRLNMEYFNFATGLTMTNERFDGLFGGPPRRSESQLTQREMDIARSIQAITEEVVLRLGRSLHKETGCEFLCLAGGVALNCVANGVLLREGPFKDLWIQPAAGDAGGALGACLAIWHQCLDKPRRPRGAERDAMNGSYLGPTIDNAEAERYLRSTGAPFQRLDDADLMMLVARLLEEECVIGWVQGRMEYGPRALGGRSIIGDARSVRMQSVMNLKIKHRESFRPFAPAVLADRVGAYFDLERPSPYMLFVAPVKESLRTKVADDQGKFGIERLNIVRSEIPAVTHVDFSARVQTVHEDTNPRFHALLKAFEKRTGCSVLVNTSFNVRGEPIVASPADAYRCFMRTEMDYLVIGNIVLKKGDQPKQVDDGMWKAEYELD